jgi:P-type Cu+ transporter
VSTSTDPHAPLAPLAEVDLAVDGMTCSSCVARVEKKLNKVPGVVATVNLATESAHVELTQDVSDADLVGAVQAAGYAGTVTRRRSTAPATIPAGTTAVAGGSGTTAEPAAPAFLREVDLAVDGMTCSSCVARVEKKLNKVPGATATVNLATESAHVTLTEDVDADALVAAIESAGYTGRVTGSRGP